MLNIDAPKDSFAYKCAVENKQLGWVFHNWNTNLFNLIFETQEQLKKYPDYYFNWELELSFFYQVHKAPYLDMFNFQVLNIPFILNNLDRVKQTIKELNLNIIEKEDYSYLDLDNIEFNPLQFTVKGLEEFNIFALTDFWKYYFYYAKKQIKENILELYSLECDATFPYIVAKQNPNLFSNISKEQLKILKKISPKYYEHNLFYLDFSKFNDLKTILKLEKKYGNKVYVLLENLQRTPTKQELNDWYSKLNFNITKDIKPPILHNKVLEVEYGWKVYELTSQKDLIKEAEYQHNCLEGYILYLPNQCYRFFSFRKNNYRFTVMYLNKKLKEIKGRFNKDLKTFDKNIQEEISYLLLILEDILYGRK